MTQQQWTAVDNYIADSLLKSDAALDAALKSSADAGLPSIAVSAPQGKFLYLLALAQRARNILEIGTLGGYSALWLARALPPDGRLVTLEADPRHAQVARDNFTRAGLAKLVDLRLGRALDMLPSVAADMQRDHSFRGFDLVFIDADKQNIPQYFQWALKLSRPGSLIIIDNVIRDGRIIDASSKDSDILAVRRANDTIAAEPRVSATTLQTVGVKGYDGLTIAVVIADP